MISDIYVVDGDKSIDENVANSMCEDKDIDNDV